VFPIRPACLAVDIELPRDKVTGKRRRLSRRVEGSRRDAEVALSPLRVAQSDGRCDLSPSTARMKG